jgi:hypothetical protein
MQSQRADLLQASRLSRPKLSERFFTRSSDVGGSRRAMESSQKTSSPSYNWHPSGFGCALMRPRSLINVLRAQKLKAGAHYDPQIEP